MEVIIGGLLGELSAKTHSVVAFLSSHGSPNMVRIANEHLSHLLFQKAGDDRVQIVAGHKQGWLDAECLDGRVLSGVAK